MYERRPLANRGNTLLVAGVQPPGFTAVTEEVPEKERGHGMQTTA